MGLVVGVVAGWEMVVEVGGVMVVLERAVDVGVMEAAVTGEMEEERIQLRVRSRVQTSYGCPADPWSRHSACHASLNLHWCSYRSGHNHSQAVLSWLLGYTPLAMAIAVELVCCCTPGWSGHQDPGTRHSFLFISSPVCHAQCFTDRHDAPRTHLHTRHSCQSPPGVLYTAPPAYPHHTRCYPLTRSRLTPGRRWCSWHCTAGSAGSYLHQHTCPSHVSVNISSMLFIITEAE
jgi:hypothetical protein